MPEYIDDINKILALHDAADTAFTNQYDALLHANSLQAGVISELRARLAEYENVTLLDKPALVRVKMLADKFGGGNGRNLVTQLKQPADRIQVSYQLFFEKGFEIHRGLKLPGPLGALEGVSPLLATDGRGLTATSKAVSGRLMLLDDLAGSWLLPPDYKVRRRALKAGEIVGYFYHFGQREKFGDNVWTNFTPPFGEWVDVELDLGMNTPGKADGLASINLNGGKQVNLTNYIWRIDPKLQWTHMVESIFPGGADMNYTAPFDRFIQLRNLKVTTSS